ncbi:hypothetical protein [Niallia sp. 03091]|uniref:hypothetical protein n=1 Tax=Niallia sp. 03091 TaxID=3458059 RepID=UPI0040441DD9
MIKLIRELLGFQGRDAREQKNKNWEMIENEFVNQKARVDNLLNGTSQPEELVDMHLGRDNTVHPTARDMVVSELNAVDVQLADTSENLNGREINAEYPPIPMIGMKADWDGISGTDNSATFKGLISSIQTNGGGKLKLPPKPFYMKGIYIDAKTWVDYNFVTIEGVNGTVLIADDASDDIFIHMGGYYLGGTDRRQTAVFNFENLKLICKAISKNIRAFQYSVTQYCNFKNVWIEGFKDGAIHFVDAYDCHFSNVHIVKCGRANSDTDYAYPLGFYGNDDCSNALFFDDLCRIEFCPLFCEFDNGARHIYFNGSKFEKMALNLTSKARPFNFLSYRELGFTNCMFINSDHYLADSTTGITGSISAGTNSLTVNQIKGGYRSLAVGDFITIAGVSGVRRITAINDLTLTLDSNVDNTVSNAVVVGKYYIVDQGKDFFNFPSSLFYDGYDVANNLLKSAKFTNCDFGAPSKTTTRWGRLTYCKFDTCVFNNCEGGAVVDRCFNIYDEVTMKNVSVASYNDAKLFNMYGKNCNLELDQVKLVSGTLSLVTIRTGAEDNNVTIGSITGATLNIPVQADASFYMDQANSRYFYLKNNKIKLLSYVNPVDNNNKPSAWMDADIVECTTTYPIEYVNFGHNGKRVTLIYLGSGGSIKHDDNYMVTKTRANIALAFGDTVNLICHNGVWREI